MIKYKGYELGAESDLYDEYFYSSTEVEEEFRALNREILLLKELLRECNAELWMDQAAPASWL
jgi:hypothetical protein